MESKVSVYHNLRPGKKSFVKQIDSSFNSSKLTANKKYLIQHIQIERVWMILSYTAML